MIKLPHRNTIRRDHNLNFNPDQQYRHDVFIKPNGFWYQINNCFLEWEELSWGNFCFAVEIKNNILNKPQGILSLKIVEEIKSFNDKYKVKIKTEYSDVGYHTLIDWEKVANDYGGFEIKNYNKIEQELRKDKNYINKYTWFNTFDFSSGFIWDLKLIKNISFFKELTDEEIEPLS